METAAKLGIILLVGGIGAAVSALIGWDPLTHGLAASLGMAVGIIVHD